MTEEPMREELKISAESVKSRMLVIRNEKDELVLEVRLLWALIAVFIAPFFTVLGIVTALWTRCSLSILKK